MARTFDGVNQKLTYAGVVLSAAPITMACWFKPDNVTDNEALMSIVYYNGGAAGDHFMLWNYGGSAGDPVRCQTYQSGLAAAFADTTSGYSAGSWQHACAVFAATNSRAVYLNGGSKGTDATNRTPANLSVTCIGDLHRSDSPAMYFDGDIAEPAIWNVALSDAEVEILAHGYSPLLVRPQSLVFYPPLIGRTSPEIDVVSGYNMTLVNAPLVAAHPRVLKGMGGGGIPLAGGTVLTTTQVTAEVGWTDDTPSELFASQVMAEVGWRDPSPELVVSQVMAEVGYRPLETPRRYGIVYLSLMPTV